MKVWAISDTHFGHEKLIEWGRPADFGDRILRDIRAHSGDILIHCGDFCIGEDEKHVAAYMDAAKGFKRKILVRGNHDPKSYSWYLERGFDHVCETMSMQIFKVAVLFSHMPVLKIETTLGFWPITRNIHGHLHGNTHRPGYADSPLYDRAYHYDLAPELHGYKLVNLESVLNRQPEGATLAGGGQRSKQGEQN